MTTTSATSASAVAFVTAMVQAGTVQNSTWQATGNMIHANKAEFLKLDKKGQGKLFTKMVNDGAKMADIDIPVEDFGRNGEKITLRKTNGQIKWSSWHKTARTMQNSSDIFVALELGISYAKILPKGNIISRPQLTALIKEAKGEAKVPETPADTIKRCLDLISKKIPETVKADRDLVDALLTEVNVQWAGHKKAKK